MSIEPLKKKLKDINQFWDPQQYRKLLDFYVSVMPRIFDCERCGIFIVDPDSHEITSAAGTNIREGELTVSLHDSIAGQVIMTARPLLDNDMSTRPGGHQSISEKTGYFVRNMLCVPLFSVSTQQVIGAVQLTNRIAEKSPGQLAEHQTDVAAKRDIKQKGFSDQDCQLLEQAAHFIAVALETLELSKDLLSINNQLESEIEQLKTPSHGLIAESQSMRDLIQQASAVGALPLGVMVTGENGTGKEQIARLIHQYSPRADQPFVAINCAAIPENLVESELFGYEKGAFTGAGQARPGKFEQASGGTLFLDEIGELPVQVQPKLLRAIQEQEGQRLGSNKTTHYDLRIVCATNRDLTQAIKEGEFREDLYYRLFSIHLHLPPLRERPEDILALSHHFLREIGQAFNKHHTGFSQTLLNCLETSPWPGNVRQLRREMERLVALTPEGEPLSCDYASPELQQQNNADATGELSSVSPSGINTQATLAEQVQHLEKNLIRQVMSETGGNKLQAAQRLGLSRPGLYKKLKRYGLENCSD